MPFKDGRKRSHPLNIGSISRNSNTSRGYQCILNQKYFPIASVDRENHNDIYFMAFALKGTVLKFVKDKVFLTCGQGHYAMQ